MSEIEEFRKIVNEQFGRIFHLGSRVDGFVTIKHNRVPINTNKSRFDVVTMGPSGNRYNWSYEREMPHRISTKNVDSIRRELDKTK